MHFSNQLESQDRQNFYQAIECIAGIKCRMCPWTEDGTVGGVGVPAGAVLGDVPGEGTVRVAEWQSRHRGDEAGQE